MATNTVIATNITSLNTMRNLSSSNKKKSIHSSRLSSGIRLNSASDSAADLTISKKMQAQLRGIDAAIQNSENSKSFLNIVEGSTSEIESMFQRCRELSVQAASDTNTVEDKRKIANEMLQNLYGVESIQNTTEYNGTNVFETIDKTFQVGPNSAQKIDFNFQFSSLRELMNGMNMELYNSVNRFFNETVRNAINKVLELDPAKVGNTCVIFGTPTALVDYSKYLGVVVDSITNLNTFGIEGVEKLREEMKNSVDKVIQDTRDKATDEYKKRMDNKNNPFNASSQLWLSNSKGECSILKQDTVTPTSTRKDPDDIRTNNNHVIAAIQDKDKIVAIDSDLNKNDPDSFPNRLKGVLDDYAEKLADKDLYNVDLLKQLEKFVAKEIEITSTSFSETYIAHFDKLISYTSDKRSYIASTINRLEYTIGGLQVTGENLYSSNSRIEDADMAEEMMGFTKTNVLSDAAMTLLAQSNSSKDDVLSLLR